MAEQKTKKSEEAIEEDVIKLPEISFKDLKEDELEEIDKLVFESLTEEEQEKRILSWQSFVDRMEEVKKGKNLDEAAREAKVAELDAEIAQLKDEGEQMKARIIKGRFPQLVSMELERRRDVDIEYSEITKLKILNSDELIVMYEDAVAEHNVERCFGILKKLAYDANFNEILNYYGYRSNWQGMHRFFNEHIIGRLKVGEQIALSMENDISYGCEAVYHWDQARIIGRNPHTGLFFQMNEDEHVASAAAEIKKTDPRVINRSFNRLAYGGEDQLPDGTRVFHLGELGFKILLDNGAALAANNAQNVRREMNTNAVGHLGNNLKLLKERGVNATLRKAIQERSEGVRKGEAGSAIIEDLQRAAMVEKYDMTLEGLMDKDEVYKYFDLNDLKQVLEEGGIGAEETKNRMQSEVFDVLRNANYNYVHEVLSENIGVLAKILGKEEKQVLKLRDILRTALIKAPEEEPPLKQAA